MPEWRARAQALGLVRERMALRPPRPLDPLTGERVRVPRVPAPDLPANEIRSMKRAPALPALPRQPRDGVAEGAEARPTGAGFRAPAELSLKPERGVLEAVARAVAHVAERRTAIPEAEIRAVALGHAPGRYTLAEVDAAIARLVRDGELIEVERRGMDRAFVTDRAVKAERRVLASMRAGRGKGMALANGEMVEKRLEPSRLTRGQREAVRTVLLSNDLVIGVQGHAGSGKTTMLSEVKELLGERKIQGLAPSAVAARVLAREAGIPTRTLQYFLTRFGDLSDPARLARGPGGVRGRGSGGGRGLDGRQRSHRGAAAHRARAEGGAGRAGGRHQTVEGGGCGAALPSAAEGGHGDRDDEGGEAPARPGAAGCGGPRPGRGAGGLRSRSWAIGCGRRLRRSSASRRGAAGSRWRRSTGRTP